MWMSLSDLKYEYLKSSHMSINPTDCFPNHLLCPLSGTTNLQLQLCLQATPLPHTPNKLLTLSSKCWVLLKLYLGTLCSFMIAWARYELSTLPRNMEGDEEEDVSSWTLPSFPFMTEPHHSSSEISTPPTSWIACFPCCFHSTFHVIHGNRVYSTRLWLSPRQRPFIAPVYLNSQHTVQHRKYSVHCSALYTQAFFFSCRVVGFVIGWLLSNPFIGERSNILSSEFTMGPWIIQ